MSVDFWIVDTFSKTPFNGSPSAVIFLDDFADETLMQNIAMELNVPETVFVRSFSVNDFEISCFSPTAKGMLFGNGLFSAAHVIRSEDRSKNYNFNLVFGTRIFEACSLASDPELIQVRLSMPTINKVPMPDAVTRALSGENIVSVAESKDALIVEVRSPKKLTNLTPNTDIFRHIEHDMVIVTADTHYETDTDYDFCARVFAPKFGVMEDRVTPLAHSRLGAYWLERIGKTELIGFQDSKNGGYVKVRCVDEYVYLSGTNITITKGVLFV